MDLPSAIFLVAVFVVSISVIVWIVRKERKQNKERKIDISKDRFFFNKEMAFNSGLMALPFMVMSAIQEPGPVGADDLGAALIVTGIFYVIGGFVGHLVGRRSAS